MNILLLIDEIIDKDNKLINKLKNDKCKYTKEELLKLKFDELESLLKDNKVSDLANKLDVIMNYYYFINLDEQVGSIFNESINNYKLKFQEIINELIIKLQEKNNDINNQIIELQNDIDNFSKIKSIIKNINQYSDSSYLEICELLQQTNIDDGELAILIPDIYKYFLSLSEYKKYDFFEEEIDKNNETVENSSDEIRKNAIAILEMYQDTNSKYYLPNLSYNGLNSEELEDVFSIIKDEGYDEINFKWIIGIYINEILNNESNDVSNYYNELCQLTESYKKSIDYKENLQLKENELFELLKQIELNNGYIKNIKVYLENIKNNQLFIISDEYYKKALNILTKYIIELKKYIIEQPNLRKPISNLENFVLFAEHKNKPYFLSDLFDPKNNMIDNRYFSNTEYFKEFNDLILDLFEYGEPSYTKFIDSKNSTNINLVIMHIFYPTKKGDVDRNNPTDMWRIRPNLSSNARFVEIKVVIPYNTIIHKQVKEIIKKHLPHIEINDGKNFTFIVNIGAAVKLADVELYNESIKRYDNTGIDILKLLYVDGKYHKKENSIIKTELNDEEYRTLDHYIEKTLEILKTLENMEFDFQFSPLLGGDTYGYTR